MKKPLRMILVAFTVLGLVGVSVFVTHHSSLITHPSSQGARYYCPMHPTYTSDRPGDCRICNMRLVKREEPDSRRQEAESRKQTTAKDICYLHNCPLVHDGKPCPMLVVAKEGEPVSCPVCGAHVTGSESQPRERNVLYWTDPMIPGFKSPTPGKSPMGMEMVPVYEEATPSAGSAPSPEGYAPVLVTPQQQQLIGITTSEAVERPLRRTIRTVGTIAHDPELYRVQTEYIQATQALTRAQAGASPEVIAQSQRLMEASATHLAHMGLSQELIEELGRATQPDHGLLFGSPGQPVWVYAKLYEQDLPVVRVGQHVTIQGPSLTGRPLPGTVRAIDPVVDPATRTVRMRAKLENPEGLLKPGMYVDVLLVIELGNRLSVANEAVFDTGRQRILFVDKGQGLFEPRDVRLGAAGDDFTEIAEGVSAGERVVTSGNFLIDSESRLKAALQEMAPPPAASVEGGAAPSGTGPGGERAGGGGEHQHAH